MIEIDHETLFGTWKIVRSSAIDAQGRALPDPWGPNPMGRLVLDRSGRMMAILYDARAEIPPGEQRLYSSYCGAFVIEGNLLTTTIDAASDPSRIGSKQPRLLSMENDLLVLMPPQREDGAQRKIYWQRDGR